MNQREAWAISFISVKYVSNIKKQRQNKQKTKPKKTALN